MDLYVPHINYRIADKVFFGIAHPFTHIAEAVEVMQGFGLTEEARRKVMYENAAAFLNIA